MGTGVVINVPRRGRWRRHGCTAVVVLAASSDGDGIGAGDVIDAWQHGMELCGAIVSESFNIKPGQRPLFVYYRGDVLSNKWYISYRAVAIV